MEVKELGHVVLYVRNVERSRKFYRDVLGWHEIAGVEGAVAAFSSGRTHHELLLIQVGEDATPIPEDFFFARERAIRKCRRGPRDFNDTIGTHGCPERERLRRHDNRSNPLTNRGRNGVRLQPVPRHERRNATHHDGKKEHDDVVCPHGPCSSPSLRIKK